MRRTNYYIPKKANNTKHSASLLELFFDLVFVAFIGSFVHRFTHMVDHHELQWFPISFVLLTLLSVVFVWRQFTIYSSRYEEMGNYRHRLFTFIIMTGIGIISAALYLDFGAHGDPYKHLNKIVIVTVPGYVLTFVPLIYLHISAGFMASNHYEKRKQYITGIGLLISSIFAILGTSFSIFFNNTWSHALTISFWTLFLVMWSILDFLSSSMRISINTRDTSLEHLQDRFGVIFIVFIGESIIQAISESSSQMLDNTVATVGKLVLVIALLFSWWWWFNDTINFPDIINHPKKISLYKFSLMFILVSLSITGVGFSGIVSDPGLDVWKYFISAGALVWSIANAALFISLKDYKLKEKILFPKIIRIAIYIMPVWNAPITTIALYPAISSATFFYIIAGVSISLIPLSISIFTFGRKNMKDENISFTKVVNDYYKREDEWIKKEATKYIDKSIHAKYDNNLNHYSKYIE